MDNKNSRNERGSNADQERDDQGRFTSEDDKRNSRRYHDSSERSRNSDYDKRSSQESSHTGSHGGPRGGSHDR